jgi:hypothetical protein
VRATTSSIALAALGLSCASPGAVSWNQVRPREAYVETLPPGALVQVDGVELGRSPLAFPVPDTGRSYEVRATAPGFEAAAVSERGDKLAGGRLEVVLRPEGFGSQRRLALGEPVGLAQAASTLLRANRPADALAFAQASLAAGESPQAHRISGEAYLRLGDRNLAVKEYSLYLSLAPDAPDRKAVEQAIAGARRDIEMSTSKPPLE